MVNSGRPLPQNPSPTWSCLCAPMLCENFPKEWSRYSHSDAMSCLASTTDLLLFGYTPWELRATRTSHKYPSPLPDMELLCAPIVVILFDCAALAFMHALDTQNPLGLGRPLVWISIPGQPRQPTSQTPDF
ncbi:hypothetical protein EXIGLDRAFT_230339 [Exidia glandulosa HHB12029]|uniref:Uncharacterized protein n=1 Tax=Exidia glandulosa HHB12029 TaxID=1314781 RepID=A0A165E717_EXIGL|nr:hypothetical protein EXIGLDRAFT_230339 [Exidia glandulosa HHB12029]